MTLAFYRKSEREPVLPQKGRRCLGLALGAGVARGWAHIGAMQQLHELGVVPDIIVGASIGAVVGGCFAAGRLEGLEEFARSLTRRNVFNLIDVSFNGGGLIGGDRLRARLEAGLGDLRIENLPTRFVAVATEIGTGHEIWLKSGSVVEAMRASYALPGIFEPVRIGGRWLFDGAIVNPVPVSTARAFGADRVIALAIGGDASSGGTTIHDPASVDAPPEDTPHPGGPSAAVRSSWRRSWIPRLWAQHAAEAPGLAAVMVNTINITQDRIMRSRLAGDPPDLLITMKASKVGLFEFHRAAELIALGRATVLKAKADILEQVEAAAAGV